MFHGSLVALITPMHEDGSIDFTSLSNLIEWHIENQTNGLVILGTTGESATINFQERDEIIKQVVKQVAERIPVIVGTGSNSTAETIKLTRHAMELGAAACLVVTPYYNKPTQEGLYQHFSAIANAVPIPLILYNVPGRTGCDLLPETVGRFVSVPNIVGLKEATGDVSRVGKILAICQDKIDLFSGDDASAFDFIKAGGKGVISVTANVAPKLMHDLCMAALGTDFATAAKTNEQLMPLHHDLFLESNPIPVKWALQEMGKISNGIRLPLTNLTNKHHQPLRTALQHAGVI